MWSSPPRRCAAARAESTIPEGSLKTAAPFGAFIFTGGAPELAGVDARSQLNRLTVTSCHRHPPLSQGEQIMFPASHDVVGENIIEFGGPEHR
jgi:hypothetical protein